MWMRMGVLTVLAAAQVACFGGKDEQCDDGFGEASDGNCYPLADDDDDPGPTFGNTNTTFGTTNTTGGTTDTDNYDGDTYLGPTLIDVVQLPGCNGAKWYYYAETVGWTDGNNVANAWETGNANGWNEEHPLPSVDFGPMNRYDILEQELTAGVAVANFQEGTTTVFQCGVHDVDPIMTYAIRVYDLDGNYTDCAIFETDDGDGIGMVFSGAAPSVGSPVTSPAELSAANCATWSI